MIKCTKCGRENDDSFFYCIDCGTELTKAQKTAQANPSPTPQPKITKKAPEEIQTCPHCNVQMPSGNMFCTECGQRIDQPPSKGSTVFMHQSAPSNASVPKVRLVLIKPDGSEAESYFLEDGVGAIGRKNGSITFPDDPFLSPLHVELTIQNEKLMLKDLDSLNGVYWRVTDQIQISPGACFRIGRELLRLELPGENQPNKLEADPSDDSRFWASPPPQPWARLVQVLDEGKIGEIHLLTEPEVIIGREEGNVRFPQDPFISSRHSSLRNDQGNCFLRDLNSSNGTYVRIQNTKLLSHQDRFQVGNQVMKIDIS